MFQLQILSARPCPIPRIEFGKPDSDRAFLQPNEKLEYKCDSGYYNNAKRNVFCITGETLSAPPPVCKPVDCPPPTIRFGKVHGFTKPGEQLNITCDPGLKLIGEGVITCVTERRYLPSDLPTCQDCCCTHVQCRTRHRSVSLLSFSWRILHNWDTYKISINDIFTFISYNRKASRCTLYTYNVHS
eukprot:sb/3471343/